MSSDEIVIIVDDRNRVVGEKPRAVMRRLNLPHRAAYILVFDRRGRLFVHRRTRTKDVFPGYYDVAAGGVVQKGETYRQSAERELAEELGIRGVALIRLFDFFFDEETCRVWGRVYRCQYDAKMTLQKEEVESGRFMEIAEILKSAEPLPITPDSLQLLQRYVETEKRLLTG